MTIATYTDLKGAVAKWLSRRSDLTDVIPDFIALGEARIAREMRLQRMITAGQTLAALAGVNTVALPDGWLEFTSVRIGSSATPLTRRSPQLLGDAWAAAGSGMPQQYDIEGNNLLLGPMPDADYTVYVSYYAKLTALSDTNATTWLLADHPGLYLWSALAEAAPFILADNRIAIWEGKYAAEKQAVEIADERARFGGSTINQVPR